MSRRPIESFGVKRRPSFTVAWFLRRRLRAIGHVQGVVRVIDPRTGAVVRRLDPWTRKEVSP